MTRGFTLIELLIVIGIISMLMAMAMPMYGVVRNMMRRSTTEYVMKKTEVAIRMFRTDWAVYPCQASYPEPFDGAGFPNRLYYQVGSDISDAQAALVRTDMAAAALRYDDSSASTLKYVDSDLSPWYNSEQKPLLNRSAREQVRLGVLAGNLRMRGPIISHVNGGGVTTIKSDRSGTLVLTSPVSDTAVGPGWAGDYLHGELEAKCRNGQSILDAWGRPLVFINQTVPSVTTANSSISGMDLLCIAPRNYDFGLGTLGFEVDSSVSGLSRTLTLALRQRLLYMGRIRLDEINAGDGSPVPTSTTDADLPYTGDLMRSDMRHFCLRGYEREFELWSVGRDGSFSYVRNADANADNIAVTPYNRGRP